MNSEANITKKTFLTTNDPPVSLAQPHVHLRYTSTPSSILDKEMSGKKFLQTILISSLIGIALIVYTNIWIDLYGLFLPVKGKSISIQNNERVSKYLLSYRYIPENFNTVIIGTSLSANLDVGRVNQNATEKIYNASIMGANISELTPVAENIINGGVKNLIICFSPYMTKSSGSKEVELNDKLYYGALGSKNLYETYLVALIRHFEVLPHKFPKNQIDQYGVNHYEDLFKVDNVKEKIAKVIEGNKNEKLTIDPTALKELQSFIQLLKDNNVNYIGYFHPVPQEVFLSKQNDCEAFERTVREFINDDSKLIDFNTPEYEWLTGDYSNYIDHGHLSNKGQEQVLDILVKEFEKRK